MIFGRIRINEAPAASCEVSTGPRTVTRQAARYVPALESNNNPNATLANAQAEGVSGRVEVKTADMRQLPFDDNTFDAIISSLAIHNIPDAIGREKALQEIIRVLKPNGQIALLDFQKTDEYIQALQKAGWSNIHLSKPNYQMFPPIKIVTGTKPS